MKKILKHKKFILFMVVIVLLAFAFYGVEEAVMPNVLAIGEAKLKNIALKCMNEAVNEIINDKEEDYTNLIKVIKDDQGNIIMVQADTVKMNDIATRIALTTQDKLRSLGYQDISIPIGNIIGGPLFSGKGPAINITVEPIGSVNTEFKTEFESAGINQTRHRIYIVINAFVRMVVGTGNTTVNISTQSLISESIIVGKVPDTYLYTNEEDDMLNLLP